jgi:hypothetical protein
VISGFHIAILSETPYIWGFRLHKQFLVLVEHLELCILKTSAQEEHPFIFLVGGEGILWLGGFLGFEPRMV